MRLCRGVFLTMTLVIRPSTDILLASPPWMKESPYGMVASDSSFASEAGAEMLRIGGNAVDAAVAVSFALAVTRSDSTGLGGGGFLIARFADGRVIVDDFRETAPASATEDMFVASHTSHPDDPPPSEVGFLAPAVPGVVAGRCQELAQFGTLPLARVVAPAIRLARNGFPVDQHYADAGKSVLETYEKHPSLKQSCGYVYRTHLREGRLRAPGDVLVQPELARLLEGIAENGPDFFYRGPVAESLADAMSRNGGRITRADLEGFAVRSRDPLRWSYRGYQLISLPPPSSGGIALAETLNILETVDLPAVFRRDPSQAAHYQIEATKHAFADRARWLGDGDFCAIPLSLLVSDEYARGRASRIRPDSCSPLDDYGIAQLPDDSGTSHFCVADRFGNVVVSTETINTSFGSLAALDEWGLILNNEMDDFAAEPGKPNAFGLVQSHCNAVAPKKKPLSSMSPTIVLKDDKPFLLLGASGGPRIITSVLDFMLCIIDYGMTPESAMLHRRVHHQWRPDHVFFDAPDAILSASLEKRGHKMSPNSRTGIVQAVLRSNPGWIGVSDPRKGGLPAAP